MKKLLKLRNLFLVLATSLFLSSCIANVEEQLEEPNTTVEKVSFKSAVKPIIDARCTSCHSPSGGTSPNLTSYQEVKNKAERVKVRVDNRTMPLGSSLSDAQIKTIVDWVNEGALDN